MKRLSVTCVSLLAALSLAQAADYKWISDGTGTGTFSWLAKNFQVWNVESSAWETTTSVPGAGDRIVGNTAIQINVPPQTLDAIILDKNNTYSAPVVGQQFGFNTGTVFNLGSIYLDFENATSTLSFRAVAGTLNLGSLTIKNGKFASYGASTTYVQTLNISDGLYIYNGTASFAVKSALGTNKDYSLGTINFVNGVTGANWSTRAVDLASYASSSFTVTTKGISGEGRITAASGVAGTIVTLNIDVDEGSTYSGRPFIYGGSSNVAVKVEKNGKGTQILTSNGSTYSGGTMINEGMLLVGGGTPQRQSTASVLGNGTVQVKDGALLGFDAYLNLGGSVVNVDAGGTLLIGVGYVSNTTIARGLTTQSDITLADGATLRMVVDGSSTYSNVMSLIEGATLTADNITLNIVAVNGALESGKTYTLITGLADGFDVSGWTLSDVDAGLGYALELNAGTLSLVSTIPESASCALLLGISGLFFGVVRRRRK